MMLGAALLLLGGCAATNQEKRTLAFSAFNEQTLGNATVVESSTAVELEAYAQVGTRNDANGVWGGLPAVAAKSAQLTIDYEVVTNDANDAAGYVSAACGISTNNLPQPISASFLKFQNGAGPIARTTATQALPDGLDLSKVSLTCFALVGADASRGTVDVKVYSASVVTQ